MFNSINGPDGFVLDVSSSGFIPDANKKAYVCPHLTYLRLNNSSSLGFDSPTGLIIKSERICVTSPGTSDKYFSLGTIVGHPGHKSFVIYEDYQPEIIGGNIQGLIDQIAPDMFQYILNTYPLYLFDVIAIKIAEIGYNFGKINEYISLISSLEFNFMAKKL